MPGVAISQEQHEQGQPHCCRKNSGQRPPDIKVKHNQANQVGKGEGTPELASKISARKTFRLERPLHALVASLCSCTHVAGTCSCIAGGPGRGVSCDQRMATFAGHIQKQTAFQRLLHVQNTIAPGLRIQKDTMYHVDFPLLQIPGVAPYLP